MKPSEKIIDDNYKRIAELEKALESTKEFIENLVGEKVENIPEYQMLISTLLGGGK